MSQALQQLRGMLETLCLVWFCSITLLEWLVLRGAGLNVGEKDTFRQWCSKLLRRLCLDTFIVLPVLAIVPAAHLGIPPETPLLNQYTALCLYSAAPVLFLWANPESRFPRYGIPLLASAHVLVSAFIFFLPFFQTYEQAEDTAKNILRAHSKDPSPCSASLSDGRYKPGGIVHLSDLHIVAESQLTTQDDTVVNIDAMKKLLALVAAIHPEYLLITGDITDSGAEAEWAHARQLLSVLPRDTHIILAPGNHDFSLAFDNDLNDAVDYEFRTRSRYPRFLKSQQQLFGDLRTVDGRLLDDMIRSVPLLPSRAAWQRAKEMEEDCVRRTVSLYDASVRTRVYGKALKACDADLGPKLEPIKMQGRWQAYWETLEQGIFPLLYLDTTNGIEIISMASTIQGGADIGTNAIGKMDEKEFERVRDSLRAAPPDIKMFIFLYHHPITGIDTEVFSHEMLRSMTELQGSTLWANALLRHDIPQAHRIEEMIATQLAKRPQATALFLFGHRHRKSLGTLGKITFVEAPNAYNSLPGVYFIQAPAPETAWCPSTMK